MVAVPTGATQEGQVEMDDATEVLRMTHADLEQCVQERTAALRAERDRAASLAEAARQRAEQLDAGFSAMVEVAPVQDATGVPMTANPEVAALFGFDPGGREREALARQLDLRYPDGRPVPPEELPTKRLARGELLRDARYLITDAHGSARIIRGSAAPLVREDRMVGTVVVWQDATAAEWAHRERETTSDFLCLVHASTGTRALLPAATAFFHERSECQAVGVRLRIGDDYPFIDARGFPPEVLRAESRPGGGNGNAVAGLECLCAAVIRGTLEPAQPGVTARGSFWANGTTRRATARPAPACPRCRGAGDASMALLPLRIGAQRLGLLHLQDPRPGRFAPETIALWERLADHFALAVATCEAEENQAWLASFPQLDPFPVLEVGLDGRLYFANPSAVRLLPALYRLEATHPWLTDWPAVAQAFRTGGPPTWAREVAVDGSWYLQVLHYLDAPQRIRMYGFDITARKTAEVALGEAYATLEQRVAARTAALSRTLQTVAAQAEEVRTLAAELTRTEQRERIRLAEQLHDGLQQLLVAAQIKVTMLGRAAADPRVRKGCEAIGSLLVEAVADAGSLTAELSPPILRTGGLVPGLRWLARWSQEKHRLTVHVQAPTAPLPPLPEDLTVLLFQAVRELLFNVVKYAQVSAATVTVAWDPPRLTLTVAEAGVGFTPRALRGEVGVTGGFGLARIRHRLELLGGYMTIVSTPGQGTQVTLAVLAPEPDPSAAPPRGAPAAGHAASGPGPGPREYAEKSASRPR